MDWYLIGLTAAACGVIAVIIYLFVTKNFV
jgi:hypothetical protein